MSTEFQLVLQFRTASQADYDRLLSLEERLIELVGNTAVVDGHDFGSGEFNIFILTADPRVTFESVRELTASQSGDCEMRAGYRGMADGVYLPLWPPNLQSFEII